MPNILGIEGPYISASNNPTLQLICFKAKARLVAKVDFPTPPDIDKIIREFQEKLKKFLPGGSSSGGKQARLVLIILGFVWLASGLYRVLPDEQGVVLRFGKFVKTTQPGLNYHIPFPVESVLTPKVTKVNRIDIGFRSERDSGFSSQGGVADVPQES